MKEGKEILLKNLYLRGVDTLGINDRPDYYVCSDTIEEALAYSVYSWVAISNIKQLEVMTNVMVKYKDGRKEVAFFDGDRRFYLEKDDSDVTEIIVEWHKLH
tara:strand:- start:355 stop:660 length:306 start_codon:yes stop_codon:yes gene_type:complete